MNLLTRLGHAIWANVGHCFYCMRFAFRLAVLGWLATGAAVFIAPGFALFLSLAAAGVSGLWLIHVLAYALKTTFRSQTPVARTNRRKAAATLFGSAVGAIALTSLPALAADEYRWCKVCNGPSLPECCAGIGRCTCKVDYVPKYLCCDM